MTKAETLLWVKQEFDPLLLATTDDAINQFYDNTVRYWNTHSAHRILKMYPVPADGGRVQISVDVKRVINVYPGEAPEHVWRSHPLWTLLGITLLDNVTSDLIMLSQAYQNYKVYTSTNMAFTFEQSQDPTVGGYLYMRNIPDQTTSIAIVCTKRITPSEDIVNEYILEWVLAHVKALTKVAEGNILRKSDMIGVNNDGQRLVEEGIEEQKELKERLQRDSRWVTLAKRR